MLRAPTATLARALSCAALAAALLGCGQVVELEAVVGRVERDCVLDEGQAPVLLRSLRVEVIDWYGGAPGAVRDSECLDDLEVPVRQPAELLAWFNERGYLVRGIPTDVPTRVQLVGFGGVGCLVAAEGLPFVCAISQDTLSETSFSEGDAARFAFSCLTEGGTPAQTFSACLGWGSHPDE